MRAAEFMRALADVIDALDGETSGSPANNNAQDNGELLDNPVMTAPFQQDNELRKAALGKNNPAIDKLLANNEIGKEGINSDPDYVGSETADAGTMASREEAVPLAFAGKNIGAS